MGLSPCRFCGKHNGSLEYTDHVYIWPEGLAHYLTDHQVRLPDEFVLHVERSMDELDEATVDPSWWLTQTGPGAPRSLEGLGVGAGGS
jgi:hypothetical protein